MPSTLKDIARALGLSPATVSRALNGFPEVNENTRIRVTEQAERLGYRPNQLARKLVSGRSGIIALVVPHAESLAEDTSFFGVVAGLSTALAAHDLDLMLHVAAAGDDELTPYHRLISKGVIDGFIFNSPRLDDPRIALAREHNLAFVVHGRVSPLDEYAYYDIDNHYVSSAAVTMLCGLGHRRIALINGPEHHSYAVDRRTGFLDTLSELGIQSSEAPILHGELTEQHGYSAVMRALESDRLRCPTAFVCGSVQIAAGALSAIREKGLRVPQDISVIAHDDHVPHYHSSEMSPPLTVTSSPLTGACRPLAELLVMQLNGNPEKRSLQKRELPSVLVRQSTGPVPLRGPK
ncbi:LacI family DNA-binding transcriptional regulator [Devosia sp. SL43]|uniref:LacI family DNA-binding transcriptional regulator n=1 Tax=Devosia sp. SL43 TaxID=2806348 RepID=UPI001F2FFA9A|nr:substrate-binding domain-containing protein [Devosia sp. SL43]UJW85552.1 substrate-binding domain-containing protein [Devosia sp. SL43]